MAEEVILSAIQNLDSCLLDFAEMKSYDQAVKEIVETMKNELTLILDFLKDSACSGDKLINYLIADVVEMAHDAQDYNIREMGSDLDLLLKFLQIERSLMKLKEWMLQLGGEGAVPLLTSPDSGEGSAVGLEETVDSLLREIILPEKETEYFDGPCTCFIRGVAGIGKTTLAKKIYNHATVAARFHYRAWVCVSGIISSKEILTELIVQIGEGEGFKSLEEMDNRSLQHMLRQHLLNKPYFVVLDDADEDTPYLTSILKALPKDNISRLLITSQSHHKVLMYYDYVHSMEFLDDDKSWELFLKTAETSEGKFPRQLKGRAKKMLKQCGGLPLAITEVGRHFAIKRKSGSKWEELLESPLDFSQTLAALELTYRRLSPSEKKVFMCLSFFEEYTTIRVEKLLQIGTMQQLIDDESEGHRALHKLSDMSFIEYDSKYIKSSFPDLHKKLHIRIVFHRLSVARAMDEINFEILRSNGSSPPSSQKTSHRVIYCSRQKFNYTTNQDEHLVSLFFRGGGYFDASPSHLERFERLIILDMEGFGLKMLPHTIGLLIKLRYLGLRNNHIQKLPDTLSCLKNLEVLDIALNFMVEVPDVIWELDNLRHLYMSNIIFQGPLKIDALENIETLTYISVDNWTYELLGLQMMNKLRKLGIEELGSKSDISKLFESLGQLKYLSSLTLRGSRFKRMPLLDEIGILCNLEKLKLDGLLTRLPSAKNFPPKLLFLTLVNSSLDEDPMPVLEKLSGLAELRLVNAYTGQQMIISNEGFKYLEFLCIKEFWHLRNLKVGQLVMPHLNRIEINDCPYLYRLHIDDCLFLKIHPETKSQLKKYELVTTANCVCVHCYGFRLMSFFLFCWYCCLLLILLHSGQ